MQRGSGLTTRQMGTAPFGSIFVWCNSHLYYPRQLAKRLQREDLRIVSPAFLENSQSWMGLRFPALILDHACKLTVSQSSGYLDALHYVWKHPPVEVPYGLAG